MHLIINMLGMRLQRCVFFLVFLCCFQLNGQIGFENKTLPYKKKIPSRSVQPGAMADLNGDLVDDLAILDRGRQLLLVKSSGQQFSLQKMDSVPISATSQWTMAIGDFNNDGSQKILSAGEYSLLSMVALDNFRANQTKLPLNVFAQASNTVDVNNDGWLDYFVCNDDGPSLFFINDRNGNIVPKDIIDFSIGDTTDLSGNYGSEWVDVNGDYLPDLCLSKCRAGVTDPTDPRRINRLYINLGNGTFVEKGKEFGLDSGEQSWVTTFGDIDNDGDQDAFVVNHYGPHALMENIDGTHFKEIVFEIPLVSFGFQSVMRDFDNDGWLDIILVGADVSIILHNRRNKNFEILDGLFGKEIMRSCTVGDLNDDGFLDVYGHLNEPINEVGLKDDQLFLNKGNDHHFVKFSLMGRTSNRSAVGSHISLYGSWGRQVRYVRGGESYGIVNSFQQHFGLGEHTKIDSVVIRWPSGIIDKYTGLEVDQTYFVQEQLCLSASQTLYTDVVIKGKKDLTINAQPGFVSYMWNTGATSETLTVDEGTYHVSMTDGNGCVTVSKPIRVVSGCFAPDTKLIDAGENLTICQGDEAFLFATFASKYLWSTGDTTSSIQVTSPGEISLTAEDFCDNTLTDNVQITVTEIDLLLQSDTVKKGESAWLISNQKNTHWFEESDLINPVFTGDSLRTVALEQNTTFYARASEIIDKKTTAIGETDFPTTDLYGGNNNVGGLVFNVSRKCILHSVKVSTDRAAVRKIVILDFDDVVIYSKLVFIDAGSQEVILDASLSPGLEYTITTDDSINLENLGYRSPRLVRKFNGTSFPYFENEVLSIENSVFGPTYFYYFFDWQVFIDIVECTTELKPVVAVVEADSSVGVDVTNDAYRIYPNPSGHMMYIDFPDFIEKMDVYDVLGQHLRSLPVQNVHDVSTWQQGVYYLRLTSKDRVKQLPFVVSY